MGLKFIFILLGFFAFHGGAAAADSMHHFGGKSVHVKLGLDIPGYDLDFGGQDREIRYKPNLDSMFSVGVSLQDFIGLTWGFRNSQNEKDLEKKGRTEYDDWRLNLAFRHFHVKLNYARFQGFYFEDSAEVDPTWVDGQPFVQEPNMVFQNSGINLTWIWKPEKFSLVAAYDQTERQEDSGGSLLLGTALNETLIKNDGELIPVAVQPAYGTQGKITEGRFQSVNLKVGYGYTFVVAKKYFASLAVMGGPGTQYMKVKGTDFSTSRSAQSVKSDALLSLGYNGDDYFGGIFAAADSTDYKTGEIRISADAWMARFYFGFRL